MSRRRKPRVLSERTGKWMLTLFPPFLFQGVRVTEVGPGFRSCRVRVGRSLLTRNLNGTIFGGSIFAGADPIYVIMYWQVFARLGYPVRAWLRQARIQYLKPGRTALEMEFALSDGDVERARTALDRDGRFTRWHTVEVLDRDREVCASVDTEVYLRLPKDEARKPDF
jgi:acyl-coenzyme A thioesterase PaaI-like protein